MTDERTYVIYTDGGARGNPGPAGIGVVIIEKGHIRYRHGEYIGSATNNVAEYRALIHALTRAADMGARRLHIHMDSELIVRQMKGEYKVKDRTLANLFLTVWNARQKFEHITFSHIRREKNKIADSLVNEALDKHAGLVKK